jgi:hypothetical protein
LLFVANEKLEPVSPVIPTSQRLGLPGSRHHVATQNLSAAPAPAPDITSQEVLAAQPKSVPDGRAKIGSAARAEAPPKKARVEASSRQDARAEASPQDVRVEASAKKARAEAPPQEAPPQSEPAPQHTESQQHQFDRFSVKSY